MFSLSELNRPREMNVSDFGNYDPVSGLPIVSNPGGKVLQGWLLRDERRGIRNIKSNWNERWCFISGKQLVVCKSADKNARRAVFELIGYLVTPTPKSDAYERFSFKVGAKNGFTCYNNYFYTVNFFEYDLLL